MSGTSYDAEGERCTGLVDTSSSVEEYREVVRRKLLPEGYSSQTHLLWLLCLVAGVVTLCLRALEPVTAVDIVSIPVTVFLFNSIEYYIHRFPSHRLLAWNGFYKFLFKSHTGLHHRFFTHSSMESTCQVTDTYFLLFPVRVYVMVLAANVSIFLGIASFLLPWNACLLGIATVSVYIVLYELAHCYSHSSLPPPVLTLLSHVPGFNYFRQHHRIHHHPRVMNNKNFNLTLPIFDWILGTLVMKLPE